MQRHTLQHHPSHTHLHPLPPAEDSFNLYGLRDKIPRFRECLEWILGPEPDLHSA